MTITAKYPGTCAACDGAIRPGQEIDWDRDTRATRHVKCPADAAEKPAPAVKAEQEGPYRLGGGSGYGCDGWERGQVLRNSDARIAKGEPEWLIVVTAGRQYIREDGMSFGVGDEQGYRYWATCREAIPEEAAPAIARREARIARAEAVKVIEALTRDMSTNGERPEGRDNVPEGETVNIAGGQNIYGGGEWFVVGPEWIWYVRNNGADGDDWALNNVRTGGAGAIGWRVPATAELAERFRALAAVAYPAE